MLIIVRHLHLHLQTATHKQNYNFPLPSRPLNNGCCCWSRRRQRWIQSSLWRQQTTLLSVFAACLSACLPVFGSFECLHTRWQTTAITITTAYYPPPTTSTISTVCLDGCNESNNSRYTLCFILSCLHCFSVAVGASQRNARLRQTEETEDKGITFTRSPLFAPHLQASHCVWVGLLQLWLCLWLPASSPPNYHIG